MYLPMPDGRTTLANFFSPLVNNMEKMFLTGKATYPVERTLLTTGLTAAGVESLYREQKRYRDAAPGDPLPADQRVDVLENLTMLTRRDFSDCRAAAAAAASQPKRIAIVTTIYRYLSHAQHMGDRFLVGLSVRRRAGTSRT